MLFKWNSGNYKIDCDLDYGNKENHNSGRKHLYIRNYFTNCTKISAKKCKRTCSLEYSNEGF